MQGSDWPAVQAIYREGLNTGVAAFVQNPPSWKAFDDGHLKIGRIIAIDADRTVIGWAALAAVPDT